MSILSFINEVFEKIFKKNDKLMLNKSSDEVLNNNDESYKSKFISSLKDAIVVGKRKGKIETLICDGDGLGIQGKISY